MTTSALFSVQVSKLLLRLLSTISVTCPDNAFFEVESCSVSGIDGYHFKKINLEAWNRLVCCVYLLKHKTLYNSEQISLYFQLTNTPLHEDKQQLLKWLAYKNMCPFTSLVQWHDFTRRVCFYHSSGSKDLNPY